jgi:hypothetical protein
VSAFAGERDRDGRVEDPAGRVGERVDDHREDEHVEQADHGEVGVAEAADLAAQHGDDEEDEQQGPEELRDERMGAALLDVGVAMCRVRAFHFRSPSSGPVLGAGGS